MLVYTIVLLAVSVLFFRESRALKNGTPKLLKNFGADPEMCVKASPHLSFIALCALISALIMAAVFIFTIVSGKPMPSILVAVSFIIYLVGFIKGFYGCSQLRKRSR